MSSEAKKVRVLEPVNEETVYKDNVIQIKKRRVCAYCRVSTDSDEQEKSYNAQVDEYKNKISENTEWEFMGIYADKGISGTDTKHRTQFNEMIKACKAGKIDLIITKSISRFARNTVDCLNHVRTLKFDYNVEVFFEKENIYSFDSKMELVLTMLSSIAQEESRNISENTKWGIKKRFKDGVAICNTNRFLGYDKDEKRNLIINTEEAKIVKRIFREYLDGKGFTSIANGLEKDNIPTVTGTTRWWDSTISGVLSNEKYCGDLLLQKTVTVDYLTKKRVDNNNIAPQYMVENNHEPIISKEMFEMVKKERERRFQITSGKDKDRRKYLTRYGFSGKLICDKCGITLKRRHWNTGTPSEKIVWQCNNYIRGIKYCNAKAVNDTDLKEAFIRLYNNLVKDKGSFFTAFLKNAEKVLDKAEKNDRLSSITDSIRQTEEDMSELVQLKIRKQVDDKTYQKEYMRISDELETLNAQKDSLVKNTLDESKAMDKVAYIKKVVNDSKEPLSEFDDELFKALIDKVIIKSPKKFVFIFESGYEVEMDIG